MARASTLEFDEDGDVILIGSKQLTGAKSEIRMKVSSKHLCLASVLFKRMLQGEFRESLTLRSNGCVEIPLPDDDPDALIVLLDICHVRLSRVPATVSLKLLAQIACLVDKYYFQELVCTLSNGWMDGVKEEISKQSLTALDYSQLAAIYYCFNRPDEFKNITREAIMNLTDKFDPGNLPLPSSYIDAINRQREGTISSISNLLQEKLKLYSDPVSSSREAVCRFECDCSQLGGLVKTLVTLKFLQPPQPPYSGHSIKSLFEAVENMKAPSCSSSSSYYYNQHMPALLKRALHDLEKKIIPVKLKERVIKPMPSTRAR